jgi:hypothetical protein
MAAHRSDCSRSSSIVRLGHIVHTTGKEDYLERSIDLRIRMMKRGHGRPFILPNRACSSQHLECHIRNFDLVCSLVVVVVSLTVSGII